tara:strand:- start:192 stop:395 length:204 start_codon:yes stop_codon:yes gene_type:complete
MSDIERIIRLERASMRLERASMEQAAVIEALGKDILGIGRGNSIRANEFADLKREVEALRNETDTAG